MFFFCFALKDLAEHSCEEEGRACWQALRYWLPHTHAHTYIQAANQRQLRSRSTLLHSLHLAISGVSFHLKLLPPPLLLYPSFSIPPSVWNKRLQLGLDPSHFLLTSPSFSICRILWYIVFCLCVLTCISVNSEREKEREAPVPFNFLWQSSCLIKNV